MLAAIKDSLERRLLWSSPQRAFTIYKMAPPSVLEGIRSANFQRVIRHVNDRSVFYHQAFMNAGIDIKSVKRPADLGNFYTTPKDLQTRPDSHFLCANADTSFETTGTISKRPKRVFFSSREIEDAGRVGSAGLWHLGIDRHDRVASAFDYSFWVSGPTLKASLAQLGSFHIEAGRITPEEFYDRIRPYGCNVLVGDPGWMVSLSEVAEKKGPWLTRLIMIGGENLSEASREYIESVWQCKVILTYGQTEAFGMIGSECRMQNGYHLNDMDLWAEIRNPGEDGFGELVYTTLRRNVMPLVRYRSGDVTRIITEPCSCGSPSIRLAKIRGRMDEMVVTGVGNIASWMMDEVLEEMKPRINVWQLRVSKGEHKDRLDLRLESESYENADNFRRQVLFHMQDKMPVTYQGIQQQLVEFHISTTPSGEIKGDQRKVRKIVDQRRF